MTLETRIFKDLLERCETQNEAAELLGVSKQQINRWKNKVKMETCERLAKELGYELVLKQDYRLKKL